MLQSMVHVKITTGLEVRVFKQLLKKWSHVSLSLMYADYSR
jgi:hypothetical protein